MEASPPAATPPPLPVRQLTLPLPALGTTPPGPSAAAPPIPPGAVWAGLSRAARQALRGTLLRVVQEVRHDADDA